MGKLTVLHVASFHGNIGDNANHTGFRLAFKKNLNVDIEYTDFEIRKIFWKEKSFDKEFVALANKHDLVIIGGGNYFELWVEDSCTGTSINIDIEDLKQISSPVVFNALGVDPGQGASELAVSKFRNFLETVNASPTMLLSCRNDGSMKALQEIVGEKYANHFFHIPDAGFYTQVGDFYHPEIDGKRKNIVIQIAGDMLEKRFPLSNSESISYEQFVKSFSSYLVRLSNEMDVKFIFVPHIFRDLSIIAILIDSLPDQIRRLSTSVAPYLIGQKGQNYIFDLYRKVDLVLGMRFHANVCALGLGVPCIGLVNYRQIDELYNEIDLNQWKVQVNKNEFDKKLYTLSVSLLKNTLQQKSQILIDMRNKLDMFHFEIKKMLVDLELI